MKTAVSFKSKQKHPPKTQKNHQINTNTLKEEKKPLQNSPDDSAMVTSSPKQNTDLVLVKPQLLSCSYNMEQEWGETTAQISSVFYIQNADFCVDIGLEVLLDSQNLTRLTIQGLKLFYFLFYGKGARFSTQPARISCVSRTIVLGEAAGPIMLDPQCFLFIQIPWPEIRREEIRLPSLNKGHATALEERQHLWSGADKEAGVRSEAGKSMQEPTPSLRVAVAAGAHPRALHCWSPPGRGQRHSPIPLLRSKTSLVRAEHSLESRHRRHPPPNTRGIKHTAGC